MSSYLTVINPGDEVIIFNPSYDTYSNVICIAGGVPVSYLVAYYKFLKMDSSNCSNYLPADFELKINRYMWISTHLNGLWTQINF